MGVLGILRRFDLLLINEEIDAHLSPEIMLDIEKYGESSLVWSLGVIVYKLLTGKLPFKNKNEILTRQVGNIGELTENCNLLLKSMLEKNP